MLRTSSSTVDGVGMTDEVLYFQGPCTECKDLLLNLIKNIRSDVVTE